MTTTPPSLLDQLHFGGRSAWDRFVELYAPLLHTWALRLEPQPADAENLVQEVFVTLLQELPRFEDRAGGRFRAWLWTVTVNKHRQLRRSPVPVPVGNVEVGQPGGCETDAIEEAEYREYLVARAMRLMQSDFEPATWKACWESVVAGRPAPEVAAELGLTPNAVYLAKARVLRRLRQELAGLLD